MSHDNWIDSTQFWCDKRALVTGGAGFLGSYVVETLRVRERGCREVFVPRSKDYDLVQLPAVQKLYADSRPDVVIHLCGAGGRHPASLRGLSHSVALRGFTLARTASTRPSFSELALMVRHGERQSNRHHMAWRRDNLSISWARLWAKRV